MLTWSWEIHRSPKVWAPMAWTSAIYTTPTPYNWHAKSFLAMNCWLGQRRRRESAPITFQKEKKKTDKQTDKQTNKKHNLSSVLCRYAYNTIRHRTKACPCVKRKKKKKSPMVLHDSSGWFLRLVPAERAHCLKTTSGWCHTSIDTLQNIYKSGVHFKCILTIYKR